jgi:NifB/MoaA-like Fe-S oxidoreductase
VPPKLIVLPATTLRKNERVFLDGMTADELERELGVPVRIAAGAAELRSILAGGLSR